jgi:DUF1680 family protein
LHDSPFKRQFVETSETYLNISNEGLLHGFRKRASLPAPGVTLAGWYGRQGFNFGQYLGSLAKMFCQTGDMRFKEKLYYLIEEWAKCIDEDGYGFFPDKNRYKEYIMAYEYEKLVGGLLDAYEYAGHTHSLQFLSRITDWALGHFPLEDRTMLYLVEWYTLPENLYRAYRLTGDEKYKTFAAKWEYPDFWDRFLNGKFSLEAPRHAYSHVNSLSGAAMAFEVTGDEKYLKIIERAYNEIIAKHIYATGGYGPQEEMFGKDGYMGDSLKSAWDNTMTDSLVRVRHDAQGSCEVSCCTWAAFKISRYLLRLTKDAKYGDWAEMLLYNGVLSLPPITDEGKVMYYANYFLDGGIKTVLDRRYHGAPAAYDDLQVTFHYCWQCCTGTYPQAVSEYSNMIYFLEEDAVYISQYVPSSIKLRQNNQEVTINCTTKYPEENRIRYTIHTTENVVFDFKFRIPSWVKSKVKAYMNGVEVEISAQANEWGSIKRTWSDNDMITIELPMPLHFKSIDEQNRNIAALYYGPLVMVTDDLSAFMGDMQEPESWIRPVAGKPLTFQTKEGHLTGDYDFLTRMFKPYYSYPNNEWYFMYYWIK